LQLGCQSEAPSPCVVRKAPAFAFLHLRGELFAPRCPSTLSRSDPSLLTRRGPPSARSKTGEEGRDAGACAARKGGAPGPVLPARASLRQNRQEHRAPHERRDRAHRGLRVEPSKEKAAEQVARDEHRRAPEERRGEEGAHVGSEDTPERVRHDEPHEAGEPRHAHDGAHDAGARQERAAAEWMGFPRASLARTGRSSSLSLSSTGIAKGSTWRGVS